MSTYKMRAKCWRYPGMAAWYFLPIDKKVAATLRENFAGKARGFGSLKVTVRLGKSKWQTSIFPDKQSGTYLLPLKAAIRRAESIDDGDSVDFSITLQR